MKITIESQELDNKATIETSAEEIHDVMQVIKQVLLGYGFHPNSVKEGFLGMAEEYKEETKENANSE